MIGQTLGHYRIDAKLGEGGMGVVYRAFDTHLNRTVAIKVLPARAVSDPARRQRFIQEARAASALDHPNIVTIYDIAEADGRLFIVMQYLAGQTLRELLARGRLPLDDVLRYAVQIADGLARAHGRGIVHRDLKPANVMVTEEGQVKLLDFGLAKLTEPLDASEGSEATISAGPQTEEGSLLGTPAYMSPEQAQGRRVDARSDIFSFGSLLHEMVTGRQAFKGDDRLSVLSAILRDEPQKVGALAPSAPAELEKLIARALRKDRERRWQSMADLRVTLTEMQEDTDSRLEAPMESPSRRWPTLWIGAAVILALVILGLVIRSPVWLRSDRPKTEPPVPPPKTVPFTSFPGQELKPAFSPDGNQLAFMWNGETSGNFDIYVKLIGAGAPLRLTTNPANDFGPNWSPDGRYIAFYRPIVGGTGIFMVPALSGPERKLGQSAASFEFASPLAWSPDGKSLAIEDQNSPQDPRAIFLLSTETREKRRLTSPPAQYLGDRFPTFSPDGQSLAFIRFRSLGVGDIYVLPVTGSRPPSGEPRRLTSDERGIWGLDWTPDGRSIVFSTNRAGDRSLWRTSATASSSSGVPERLPAGGENAYSPSVSRQGHRLAYEHYASDMNIWRIEVPSATRRRSTGKVSPPTKLIASTRNDRNPQFSPDGKKIVFASFRSGSDEIWMCDSEGSNPVQLTSFGGPPVSSPRWAPDGQRIAFESAKEGSGDIYLVSAEGGMPHRLTTEPSNDVRPSWSKDGRWIYFGSDRSGAWQVWKVPAQGGRAVQVTKKGGREAFESSDGKFVYYAKPDALGLWRVPVEGGEETQVLDQGDQGFWALLDEGIYFLNSKATPSPVIEFFSFATRRLTEIAVVPKEANTLGGGHGFAVSPDGRWLLYVQIDHTESDIVLVENFR